MGTEGGLTTFLVLELVFEVITQENGCGDVVERGSFSSRRGIHFCHGLGRLPAGQPLVYEFHFDAQIFLQSCGEERRFIRHGACFTAHVQRMAHEDTRNTMLPANFAQAPQIVTAIGACEGDERLRGDAEFVGEREADSLSAIVHRQNAARFGSRGCGHTDIPRAFEVRHIPIIILEVLSMWCIERRWIRVRGRARFFPTGAKSPLVSFLCRGRSAGITVRSAGGIGGDRCALGDLRGRRQ